jgi:hypothetical protein
LETVRSLSGARLYKIAHNAPRIADAAVRPPPADKVSGIEQISSQRRRNTSGEGAQRWCRIDMAMLPPLPGDDWSEGECAHIDRFRTTCKNTEHWELESSRTDAGDPWCIIYDRHQQRIVLHFARIDRRYVIVWPKLRRSASRATIAAAVDLALAEHVPELAFAS